MSKNYIDNKNLEEKNIYEILEEINVGLIKKGEFFEALRQLMLLTVDHMENSKLWLMVGLVYTRVSYWMPAIGALETALYFDPHDNQIKQVLSLALFSVGKREEACKLIDQVCSKKNANSAQWMLRAYLHGHTRSDSAHALRVARDWGRRFADPLTRNAKPLKVMDRNAKKKLKVGYVTGDFRNHSVAFFMQPVLENHNPENVEVHVYFNAYTDHVTLKMKNLVPHWFDVLDMTDDDLCEKIRQDGIDILVDLSGFTQGHRLGVFARRAAPVQVTWLGYMLTLGMKAMDYRLVDVGVAPLGHQTYYSENLFYLACMASYTPPAYAPLCEELPMLRNGYPTLVSLNSSSKITDAMLRVWARILHARPDARLIIIVKEENADAAQAHMQPRVEAAGMPLDRVSVMPQQPLEQFMEIGHIADIALDTSPISGGTTTLHTLWMGMPIVCMDAERGVDAATARTLRGLGFGGEIAQDEKSYIGATLQLMDSPERLYQQRKNARGQLQKSVLMDYAARTQELEKAYRLMWLNWLKGKHQALSVAVDMEALLAEMDAAQ